MRIRRAASTYIRTVSVDYSYDGTLVGGGANSIWVRSVGYLLLFSVSVTAPTAYKDISPSPGGRALGNGRAAVYYNFYVCTLTYYTQQSQSFLTPQLLALNVTHWQPLPLCYISQVPQSGPDARCG